MFRSVLRFAWMALVLASLAGPVMAQGTAWSACFTPAENCEFRIVTEIAGARETIRVQAFSFTSRPITAALIEAARRGVDVRLIVGHSRGGPGGRTRIDEVAANGVRVLVDNPTGLMHDKIMIIDGETVVTGSFNFTSSAQKRNVENVLIVTEPALARRYDEHWRDRASVSYRYEMAAGEGNGR